MIAGSWNPCLALSWRSQYSSAGRKLESGNSCADGMSKLNLETETTPGPICPILGRATTIRRSGYSTQSWQLVECQETGLVYLLDPPEYEEVASEFAWQKTFVSEKAKRRNQEPAISRVSSFLSRTKAVLFRHRDKMFSLTLPHVLGRRQISVLDVGSGHGHRIVKFCRKMKEVGIEVVPSGIEISPELAKKSNRVLETLGGRVLGETAINALPRFAAGTFDIAFMNCYLEHESQPLEVLKRTRAILKPDGMVVIKVPNFGCFNRRVRGSRWCGFRFPDHVNYFTPATLRRVAEEAGFEMQSQRLTDRFPTSDNMYAVLKS